MNTISENLRDKLGKIKIIFMDVDGVLNDGKVYFMGDASPKTWFVRDRLGIKLLKKLAGIDIKIIWISGRPSKELSDRADELGVDEVYEDIPDKLKIMEEVLSKYNMEFSDAVYIGDDLVDLACMERAGVSCCPSDAVGEVRVISDFISAYPGGRGAVREIIEEFLRSRGVWEKIVSEFKKTI
jgi:YrbI family 3-deoxy-D-manno-octulosonate 8-phosphate phosphatase